MPTKLSKGGRESDSEAGSQGAEGNPHLACSPRPPPPSSSPEARLQGDARRRQLWLSLFLDESELEVDPAESFSVTHL